MLGVQKCWGQIFGSDETERIDCAMGKQGPTLAYTIFLDIVCLMVVYLPNISTQYFQPLFCLFT